MNSRCDRLARDRQACDRQARAAGLAAGGPVVGCDREARAAGLAAGEPGLVVPAHLAIFSLRQGVRSFLPWNSSCLTSFILNPAGYEKLVAKG